MTGTVSRAAVFLQSADNLLILTHRRPDGDTAGSAGALCRGLRQLGKTAYIAENREITRRYGYLIEPMYPPEGFCPDVVVSVDVAGTEMLPPELKHYADSIDLVIDHHGSNPCFGRENLVGGEYAACAEIVCAVLEALEITIDRDIAEAIYVGISTDTGCFKFSNTTENTHLTAITCMRAGVDCGELNQILFDTKSRARYEIERILYNGMRFYRNGTIAVGCIGLADRKRVGADWDDLDAIAGLTRQIEGVQVGLTFTELESGETKVSVRTTKEADAAAICCQLGGGGHVRAAGATLPCGMEDAVQRVLEATERMYRGEA